MKNKDVAFMLFLMGFSFAVMLFEQTSFWLRTGAIAVFLICALSIGAHSYISDKRKQKKWRFFNEL